MYQAFEELSHFLKIRNSDEWLRGNKAYFDTLKTPSKFELFSPYRSPG